MNIPHVTPRALGMLQITEDRLSERLLYSQHVLNGFTLFFIRMSNFAVEAETKVDVVIIIIILFCCFEPEMFLSMFFMIFLSISLSLLFLLLFFWRIHFIALLQSKMTKR